MRLSAWSRSLLAVWSVWLGAVLIAPASLHTCAMHDGHAGHMGATPMHASAHMGDHGAPADDSNKPCTCLGAGCCAAIVGVPSLALVALREIPVRVVTVVAPARAIVAPFVAPEYSHPFANGPPASRST